MSDSHVTEQDSKPVEENQDDVELHVVDPDDYQKTKKLESIHKARKQVRDVREENPGMASDNEWKGYRARLGTAVADYGNELMPLIEDGLESGVLSKSDLENDLPESSATVEEFVWFDGYIPDHEKEETRVPKPGESMAVYRQLDRILRKLGLGLEFDEDQGPAEL